MERLSLSHQVQVSTQMTKEGLLNINAVNRADGCLLSNKRGA